MDMSLTKPVSAEQPCGPDPEYDPEYLLLFSRAAPQAEAQYGDFVSTPRKLSVMRAVCSRAVRISGC